MCNGSQAWFQFPSEWFCDKQASQWKSLKNVADRTSPLGHIWFRSIVTLDPFDRSEAECFVSRQQAANQTHLQDCLQTTSSDPYKKSSMKIFQVTTLLVAFAALVSADITEKQAKKACAKLKDKGDRQNCVFDVLATQDLDMAEAY